MGGWATLLGCPHFCLCWIAVTPLLRCRLSLTTTRRGGRGRGSAVARSATAGDAWRRSRRGCALTFGRTVPVRCPRCGLILVRAGCSLAGSSGGTGTSGSGSARSRRTGSTTSGTSGRSLPGWCSTICVGCGRVCIRFTWSPRPTRRTPPARRSTRLSGRPLGWFARRGIRTTRPTPTSHRMGQVLGSAGLAALSGGGGRPGPNRECWRPTRIAPRVTSGRSHVSGTARCVTAGPVGLSACVGHCQVVGLPPGGSDGPVFRRWP